eukprot:UN28025
MDKNGLLSIIRDDLRTTLASMIASNGIRTCKTYCVGHTYKMYHKDIIPKKELISDIDIISSEIILPDSEIIYTCHEILSDICDNLLNQDAGYVTCVSDARLFDYIVEDYCGFTLDQIDTLKEYLTTQRANNNGKPPDLNPLRKILRCGKDKISKFSKFVSLKGDTFTKQI